MADTNVTITEHAYLDGDLDLLGFVARPDSASAALPGVLVVPAVFGMTDHPRDRARMLADLGYVSFVADLYGNGASFGSLDEAMPRGGALMGDIGTWIARMNAALVELRNLPGVDATRVAAVGFCFGGTGVLELAYAGTDLAAVASFHGGLGLSDPQGAKRATASILVCTGAEDPLVPEADVAELQRQLRGGGADWQIQVYGGALHAFTDPAADSFGTPVAGYSPIADARSWQSMAQLLAERFGSGRK